MLLTIPTLLGVSFLIWFVLHVLYNGDPLAPYVTSTDLSDEQYQALEVKYGLDKPWYVRFVNHMIALFQGNFGLDRAGKPILQSLIKRIPISIELITISVFLALLIGIPAGIKASSKRNTLTDGVLNNFSVIGYAFPSFVTALFFQYFIYNTFFTIADRLNNSSLFNLAPYKGLYNYHVFPDVPDSLINSGFHLIDALFTFNISYIFDVIIHFIFPVICVTFIILPLIIKLTRQAMLNTLNQDFILLAKAKGLNERRILYNHALRNAIYPLTTAIGLIFGFLLIGTVFVEYIFQIPGAGLFLISGVKVFDMPVIQGFVVFSTVSYVLLNLIVDLAYGYLDPRVR